MTKPKTKAIHKWLIREHKKQHFTCVSRWKKIYKWSNLSCPITRSFVSVMILVIKNICVKKCKQNNLLNQTCHQNTQHLIYSIFRRQTTHSEPTPIIITVNTGSTKYRQSVKPNSMKTKRNQLEFIQNCHGIIVTAYTMVIDKSSFIKQDGSANGVYNHCRLEYWLLFCELKKSLLIYFLYYFPLFLCTNISVDSTQA